MGNFFHQLFERFNTAGLHYAVLRNYEHLLTRMPKGDVDILMDERSFRRLKKLMRQLLPHGATVYSYSEHSNASITYYVCCAETTDLVALEIRSRMLITVPKEHSLLGYKELQYMDVDSIIRSRVEYENFYVPSPEDYLEHLLSEKYIAGKSKYDALIDELSSKTGKDVSGANHETLLSRYLENNYNTVYYNISHIAGSVLSRIRSYISPRGKLIVLLGPDGVGKTTLADSLAARFQRRAASVVREHLGNRPKLLFSYRLGRPVVTDPNIVGPDAPLESDICGGEKAAFGKRLYHSLRIVWHALDFLLHYYAVIRPNLAKGAFVISERYTFDYLLFPERNNPLAFHFFRKLMCVVAPKPDVVIALAASPDNIRKRKKELGVPTIERYLGRTRDYSQKHNIPIISTDVPVNQTVEKAVSLICR